LPELDEFRFVHLSALDEHDLKRLAALHRSVMHTLLADLGLPIVTKYYQVVRSDLSVIGICAVNSSNDLVGWALGSPDPAAVNKKLRHPLAWFLAQLLQVAVTRPRALSQLVASVFSSSAPMEHDAIELTYIGVAASAQGKGLGRALLDMFVEESRARSYHSVVLSVEDENKAAISLYEKSGFKVSRSFSEGRYQRHRMELTLG
jgi:ribosomal protein S18 acetylase RimI-like enzyme